MSVARIAAIVCAVSLAVAVGPAPGGQDGEAWPVKGKLIGKTKMSGKAGLSKDVSGIACTTDTGFPRDCLVIDDNLQFAQFVTVKDGKLVAGDTIRLMRGKFEGEPLELDGQGVAFSKGFYYVIGSHGRPRGKLDPELIKARIDASSQIIRFRAKHGTEAKIERTSNLKKMIAAEPAFDGFRDQQLEENGLTIEGIAVKDGTLFAGFRGPVLDDNKKALVMRPRSMRCSTAPLDHPACSVCRSAKVAGCAISPPMGAASSSWRDPSSPAPARTRSIGGTAQARTSDCFPS